MQRRHRDGARRSRSLRPLRTHGAGIARRAGGGAGGGRRCPGHRGRERLRDRPPRALRDRPGSSLDGGLHQPGPVSGPHDHPLPMPQLTRRRADPREGSGWIDTMRASRRDSSRRQEAGVRAHNGDLPRVAVVPGDAAAPDRPRVGVWLVPVWFVCERPRGNADRTDVRDADRDRGSRRPDTAPGAGRRSRSCELPSPSRTNGAPITRPVRSRWCPTALCPSRVRRRRTWLTRPTLR